MNLKTTQLESVKAIERLTVFALSIAVRILQLLEGRNNSELPASITLTDERQQCLT